MVRTIRPVKLEDVAMVSEIEQTSFPDPWDRAIFEDLASHGGTVKTPSGESVVMRVVEEEGKVTGYVVWQQAGKGPVGTVLNIAIRRDCRRRGQGRLLMAYTVDAMRRSGLRICSLEARESNTAARLLYESLGMTPAGRRPGYYGDEDAIIYTLVL